MAKLILGCGYLGRRVAERWSAAGEIVWAVTRSPERAAEFTQHGWRGIVADVTQPETLRLALKAVGPIDTVVFAVGHDRAAAPSIEDVYVRGLAATLDALPDSVLRFVYVSSTGVYGQTDGSVVDEDSPCRPERAGGRACLAAEQTLAASRFGPRAIVLRMAGIYGPGRIPRQRELLAGAPLAAPEDGFLNLIYVDDAAQTVIAAAERARAPATFVVSDGHPAPRREYYAELARQIGAPPPRFVAPPVDSAAAERAGSDKRVSNARMSALLGVAPQYPDYRRGIAAALAAPTFDERGRA